MLSIKYLAFGLILGGISGQDVDKNHRIDCYPDVGASPQSCNGRGCIWDNNPDGSNPSIPLCYFPSNTGYTSINGPAGTYILTKKADSSKNPFGADVTNVIVKPAMIGKTLNIRFEVQGGPARYEPPLGIPKNPSSSSDSLQFNVGNAGTANLFQFTVTRASTKTNLWDTSIGGLLFADKYIQIATLLPSDKVYGFGESIHQRMKHDFSRYTTWAMFARDEAPNSGNFDTKNLYSVHPFYICVENDGKAHGVFILNSNAQEVTTGMAPHLVYRTIGGMLDLYFFPGPSPEEVVTQYLALIGTPMLPAYWALGFQLCRYGYQNLDDLKAAVGRTMQAGIPLDVVFADIDYMDHHEDFTTGGAFAGFPEYAKQLHDQGLRITLIFDPAIEVDYDPFQRGINSGARFIEWARQDQVPGPNSQYPMTRNTKIMLGHVWPDRHTAFPDFLDPSGKTDSWWADEFVRYHGQVPFDGIWIDMNEPSNFGTQGTRIADLVCPTNGPDSALDSPPFQTQAVYLFGGVRFHYLNRKIANIAQRAVIPLNPFQGSHLCTKTLCMLGKTGGTMQYDFYDTKNLYGWSEARSTLQALGRATGKRGEVISRSTFPSAGRYGGHWLGDNTARWADLRTSVIGAMEFNFFGIPFVGSDICGFNGASNEELCLRWQQMGAFHPFSRNHNAIGNPPQDPATWPTVAAAAKKANLFRYYYLPYLYSLHYEAALNGHTVLRPLFFEFPTDAATLTNDAQFLWGAAFLITPVLTQGANTVSGYFPNDVWYSLYDSNYASVQAPGQAVLNAPTTSMIPVHVRGGYILPRQAPSTTTTASRNNPFELLTAIKGNAGNGMAQGQLYWDDGDALPTNNQYNYFKWVFQYSETTTSGQIAIQRTNTANGLQIPTLDILEFFGYNYNANFNSFTLDGKALSINTQTSSNNPITKRLIINTAKLIDLTTVKSDQPSILRWTHS